MIDRASNEDGVGSPLTCGPGDGVPESLGCSVLRRRQNLRCPVGFHHPLPSLGSGDCKRNRDDVGLERNEQFAVVRVRRSRKMNIHSPKKENCGEGVNSVLSGPVCLLRYLS